MKELFTFLLLSTMFLCFALETYKVGGGYEETSILPGETLTIEADVPPPPPNENSEKREGSRRLRSRKTSA